MNRVRPTRPPAAFQQFRDPDLSCDQGTIRAAAAADHGVCEKPFAIGRTGLGSTGVQFIEPSSKGTERELALS